MFDLVNTQGFPVTAWSPFFVQEHKNCAHCSTICCIYSCVIGQKYIPLSPVTPSSWRHSINLITITL